ncbi:MAG TPA: NAD-binding protein, partial [Pirellulaceae bacterium]
MGKTIVHLGGPGAGQIAKACNQIVVAINYAAVSEALVLAKRAGVDPAKVAQVLGGGLANSRVLEMRGPTMIERSFEPGFRVD